MKILQDIALWTQLRPQVIHRLPGRLRLRIGLLRRVPEKYEDLADILECVLTAPEGVLEARADRRTGSLTICYDPEILQESDVLEFLRNLLELLRRHRQPLAEVHGDRTYRVAGNLEAWIREHMRRRPMIDPQTDIPDEVWS